MKSKIIIKKNKFKTLKNTALVGLIQAISNNIGQAKLVFFWLNMGQKMFNVLMSKKTY